MPEFAVIIPAAGLSSRFGASRKKPFAELDGQFVWRRSVQHFTQREDVAEVILVLAESDINEFNERFMPDHDLLKMKITTGGASRAESVENGIKAIRSTVDYIAVHDVARPLLTQAWISNIFNAAVEQSAAIPGVAVSSTVKQVDEHGMIQRTVDRSDLRLAQTPQVFRRDLLESAYESVSDPSVFTDESALVEASGQPVFVMEGWPFNIKITTLDDLQLAHSLLELLSSGED